MKSDGGLRAIFRKHLPSVHWVSIETGLTEAGVPDMNGCARGVDFWVENKMTHGFQVSFQPEQVGWLLRRSRAGGRCFVAVRRMCESGKRRAAADELWLYRGEDVILLRDLGLGRANFPPLGRWERGPARWGWDGVEGLLLGPREGGRGAPSRPLPARKRPRGA